MRQRVMIAMALLCTSRILLILGKAYTAASVTISEHRSWNCSQSLQKKLGIAIIMAAYDLGISYGRTYAVRSLLCTA